MAAITLPSPFSTIPLYRLSYDSPSPVHLLSGLTQYVNKNSSRQPQIRLFSKREDQAGSLTCYGNKYRKFEYIIPDILARKDVTTIVTEGALQSNHTVQVASMARVIGKKCTVLLHMGIGGLRKAVDKDTFLKVGNVQLNRILGADVRITDETDTGDENGPLVPILDQLKAQGERPYWISSGASLHPLGGLGYARCAFEIASQEKELTALTESGGSGRFDYIFVACGSGSTLAGLIAGFKLLEKTTQSNRQVIGIMTSPTKSRSYQEERILRLARKTGHLIGLEDENNITAQDIHLEDAFVGEGYGILDHKTAEAINLAAQVDSLLLDPVYTAKVMRGMLAWAKDNRWLGDSAFSNQDNSTTNALFIHTGGQTALSAYEDVWSRDSRDVAL
ncbi:hypothetical protein LTS08_000868 [Lithohypha guttulata]|uniref:uncharacterized protein n=1 Tax=Lithohypha guttulata TaxID=1690604 RepID=UPI002DDFE742|nr:hypothetical protein LTR51_006518 [Lithohypha guttulata]KAK5106746.1 hypothetical protein LTS08_000868 [Lithohypha guttulata]